jgi:L-lactate dehydrogenase
MAPAGQFAPRAILYKHKQKRASIKMANKVMIVGTGNVGMSYGFALVHQRTDVNELVLVDINTEDAEGEAIDLRDCLAVAPS